MPDTAEPTSLRAYAKHRGVSVEAVSKAITVGRLRDSVTVVGGKPKIADVELADREWDANTRQRIDQPRDPLPAPSSSARERDAVQDYNVSRALKEAALARKEAALADLAELEAGEKRGDLVPVDEARRDVLDKFTVVKTKILGVPSRVAQRLPKLAAEVVPVVDALLREALEELAMDDAGDDCEIDDDEEDDEADEAA